MPAPPRNDNEEDVIHGEGGERLLLNNVYRPPGRAITDEDTILSRPIVLNPERRSQEGALR
jgi:hypothetical protein